MLIHRLLERRGGCLRRADAQVLIHGEEEEGEGEAAAAARCVKSLALALRTPPAAHTPAY